VVPIYGNCESGMQDGKPHQFSASAVVIGRRWVVTAAHVVSKTSGVRVRVRGAEHAMKRVIVNRMFKEENLGRYDIALCESEDDMALDFYPGLYEGSDESGKVASICGYGSTGTFSSGAVRSDGRKRAGSNKVDRAERHVLVCSTGSGAKTELEFVIAPGDSGGGMFIDQKLAGINSFVSAVDGKSNSDYGDECAHTRISLFVPWIRACMNGEEIETSVADGGSDVVLDPERGPPAE
jgi:secreted trypsin-like serine protease